MYRSLHSLTLTILLALVPLSPLVAQERRILAVMDIQDKSGLEAADLAAAVDYLRGLLARSGRFEIVDKGRQEAKRKSVISDLQRESGDSCYDDKCRVRLGQELAADTLLLCSVAKLGSRCALTCELIPLEKATADNAGVARFDCGADGLAGAIESVALQLNRRPGGAGVEISDGRVGEVSPQEVVTRDSRTGVEWVVSVPAGVEFARSETTVDQYKTCLLARECQSNSHEEKSDSKNCNWGYSDRGNHPMNCIDWAGAKAFCDWAGGRLPSADEWYAEASNEGKRAYPWGNRAATCDNSVWDTDGSTGGCGKNHTWPVCSKTKGNSISGLCDMSGNVWEWTSTATLLDFELRGASWSSYPVEYLRSSHRFRDSPVSKRPVNGFRCVREWQ